jgi:hypothetical protein
MVAMKVKHLAHLALARVFVFGTGAAGAENQKQGGRPAQVRSSGGANVNAGGAKFHAQPQGGVSFNRGNTARIQNQNRIIVREQDFNRNVKRNRAVIKQQNFQQQSVQRIGQDKIHPDVERRASGRASVQISQTQRVHIREAFRNHRRHFHRVVRVGFPIFIGAYVPSDYTFYDMPSDFVEYVPEYEEYKYIIVGDQLLIIDPDTWEIVAIIPL